MARLPIPKVYRDVLAEHRRRLERLSGARRLGGLRKSYEQAIATIEKRLATLGPRSATFTAHQHRLFLGQLRQGLKTITQSLTGDLSDIGRDAQVDALRGLIGDIGKLEAGFTGAEVVLPIEEAARFQSVISGVRHSMLHAHEVSMTNYGVHLVRKMEDQLSVSLLSGEDLGTTIDRVTTAAGVEWWKGEEIVRTELLWSYSATARAGLQAAAEELPDLMIRWTEYVDDAAPHGLDDRVDVDSIALHGQVAAPDGQFHFPDALPAGAVLTPTQQKKWSSVRDRFAGESWAQPPNRPNDRASLSPVRPHWKVPCWIWDGGQRVNWP